jgi:1-acyl-sn-glycerol-3-phosphate acyltransferase
MVVKPRDGEAPLFRISEVYGRRHPNAARRFRLIRRQCSDRLPSVIIARSVLFNILFYLNLLVLLIAAIPTLLMPSRAIIEMAKLWGRTSLWLLRVICGITVEFRGVEKIPPGPLIVAAKHQSTWETFALLSLFRHPIFIIKRELTWIPLFGWFTLKGRMISVDRGSGSQALTAMTVRARDVIRGGRQLFIFPEGTRRPAGAEPKYKFGVAHLYDVVGVPCVPVALNSGLFWRRRSFLRLPGTIVVEFLDPIQPGLDKQAFFTLLQDQIESATARLVAEGERELRRNGTLAAHQTT